MNLYDIVTKKEKKQSPNGALPVAENAENLKMGDPVIITGDVQFKGATGEIESFGQDNRFVVVNLYNHGKHSFHSSDVSFNDYTDDEDEEQDQGFFVVIASEDNGVFIGMVAMDSGKWREMNVSGAKPYNWGQQYMSYLTPQDVMNYIEREYGATEEVVGPFESEEEAREYARDYFDFGANDDELDEEQSGPIEAYGYAYNKRDQRVMWRKVFKNEQELERWIDAKNATLMGTRPVEQPVNEAEIEPGTIVTLTKVDGREYTGSLSRMDDRVVVLKVDGTTGDAHGLGNQPASNVLVIKRDLVKSVEPKTMDEDVPPPENARKTQIAGTLPTYKKAADMLNKTGVQGKALDFGAGLGMGTGELGPDAHSYEPFPNEKFKPHFVDVTKIPSNTYHKIVNLNVLNVVPNAGDQRIRDSIVQNIGRVLAPGGVAIITTRGKDVLTIKGTPGEEPMSMISKIGTYQKGFTSAELKQYVQSVLGNGFEVSNVKLGPAGVMIKKQGEQGVAEGIDNEELANEVYAEFERMYPNLARRADERTVHAAIMDVLNYGGDSDPSALAQDVARAVKRDIEQGVAEASKDSAPKMGSQERKMAKDAVKGGKDMSAALGLVRGKDGVARLPASKKTNPLLNRPWVSASKRLAKEEVDPIEEANTSHQHHVVSKLDGNVLASYKTKQEAHKNAHGNPVVSGSLETIGDKQYVKEQGVAEGKEESPVVNAITRRIMLQRTDLLGKYGLDKVTAAINEVADFIGDIGPDDEIGSSDVSGWVKHVEQMLSNMGDEELDEVSDFKRNELRHELAHERNNIQVVINGKPWKVFPGRGYADSREEWQFLQSMKTWADKKSAQTGKKWSVHLTGASPTLEESDISGLLAAAHLNKAFIVTAELAEGGTKRFRVKAQSAKVAVEKFKKHASMAKVIDVKEVPFNESSYKPRKEVVGTGLSNELLGAYKKAAGISTSDLDKAGKYDKAHKRYKGINQATEKQFINDLKSHKKDEDIMQTAGTDSTSPIHEDVEDMLASMKRAGYDIK